MKTGNKCPECNSCLYVVWLEPRRFFHCWFCWQFYDKAGNSFEKVDVTNLMLIPKDVINQMMSEYYEKEHERYEQE